MDVRLASPTRDAGPRPHPEDDAAARVARRAAARAHDAVVGRAAGPHRDLDRRARRIRQDHAARPVAAAVDGERRDRRVGDARRPGRPGALRRGAAVRDARRERPRVVRPADAGARRHREPRVRHAHRAARRDRGARVADGADARRRRAAPGRDAARLARVSPDERAAEPARGRRHARAAQGADRRARRARAVGHAARRGPAARALRVGVGAREAVRAAADARRLRAPARGDRGLAARPAARGDGDRALAGPARGGRTAVGAAGRPRALLLRVVVLAPRAGARGVPRAHRDPRRPHARAVRGGHVLCARGRVPRSPRGGQPGDRRRRDARLDAHPRPRARLPARALREIAGGRAGRAAPARRRLAGTPRALPRGGPPRARRGRPGARARLREALPVRSRRGGQGARGARVARAASRRRARGRRRPAAHRGMDRRARRAAAARARDRRAGPCIRRRDRGAALPLRAGRHLRRGVSRPSGHLPALDADGDLTAGAVRVAGACRRVGERVRVRRAPRRRHRARAPARGAVHLAAGERVAVDCACAGTRDRRAEPPLGRRHLPHRRGAAPRADRRRAPGGPAQRTRRHVRRAARGGDLPAGRRRGGARCSRTASTSSSRRAFRTR